MSFFDLFFARIRLTRTTTAYDSNKKLLKAVYEVCSAGADRAAGGAGFNFFFRLSLCLDRAPGHPLLLLLLLICIAPDHVCQAQG